MSERAIEKARSNKEANKDEERQIMERERYTRKREKDSVI